MVGSLPIPSRQRLGGAWIPARCNAAILYFALRGEVHDGHEFISDALSRGAVAAVVEQQIHSTAGLQIGVPDTLAALQQLARYARKQWGGQVVGVTGSAGKTSTKDAIAHLLATKFPVGKTVGNFNNHVGLPLSVLRLPGEAKIGVLEMGMNHSGEIRALAKIALPDVAVVTNVGYAHVEFFDGIDGIALAKRELVESLSPEGIAVLNADDPRVAAFAAVHPGRSILYGFGESANVRGEQIAPGAFRCLGVEFQTKLIGHHAVSNLLAAIAVAQVFGIAPEELRDAVASLTAGAMRGERFQHGDITIFNDCYNSNPEAARSMVDVLRDAPGQRKIAVLGEMLELGANAEPLHRGLGRYVAGSGIDVLIAIRGAARFMADEAGKAGMSGSAAYFFDDAAAAGEFLRGFAAAGDTILFKGSRGVHVENALASVYRSIQGGSLVLYYLLYDRLYPAINGFRAFRYVTTRTIACQHHFAFCCAWY